ncbi:hypothetical protein QCA50_007608 [Cerrena zonata]|uniref:Cytochrome P450 n=1 Tax=Cerrena zonata TaxID=2478898 RepID=A0AAW0GG26_9APHY
MWLSYSSMAQKYGDIVHLKALTQNIIIVSSMEAASDLFDKRAKIYSDRFRSTMIMDLLDMSWSLGLLNYGEPWRKARKFFHYHYNTSTIRQYDGLQFDVVRRLLRRLRTSPERFLDHSQFTFAALILRMTYGVHIENERNEHVVEATLWLEAFNEAIQPGRFWVDIMPILKYVPTWFPGAGFKKFALKARKHMYNALDRPLDFVKANLLSGTGSPSIAATALENIDKTCDASEQENLIRNSLGAAFGAGVDTTSPTLQLFFYLMMTHPDIQKKAQNELHTVIGERRLPTLNDRPNLPYVEAIVKEVLRWQPVTPLALPHYTAAADEYRGYYIPKGSVVLGNAWYGLGMKYLSLALIFWPFCSQAYPT